MNLSTFPPLIIHVICEYMSDIKALFDAPNDAPDNAPATLSQIISNSRDYPHIMRYIIHKYASRALMCILAEHGMCDQMEYISSLGVRYTAKTMSAAVGDIRTMKWLYDHGCPYNQYTLDAAVQIGSTAAIKWLREIGCAWDEDVFEEIVATGNIELIEWARMNNCPWNARAFRRAASGGDIDTMKWLLAHRAPWSPSVMAAAIDSGCLDAAKWLYDNKCPMDEIILDDAAYRGDLEIMQWLDDVRGQLKWSARAMRQAVLSDKLETLKWLHKHRAAIDGSVFEEAAGVGNIRVMKWLRAHGAPWDTRTFVRAVANGKIEVLRWLKINNCPWSSIVFTEAAARCNLAVMKWLRANGCPCTMFVKNIDESIIWACAFRCGRMENLKWLHEQGLAWGPMTFVEAVETNNIDILIWLKKMKCPWDPNIYHHAGRPGDDVTRKWLLANNYKLDRCLI